MSLKEPYERGGLNRAARAAGAAFGWQDEAESTSSAPATAAYGGFALLGAGATMIGLTLYFWLG